MRVKCLIGCAISGRWNLVTSKNTTPSRLWVCIHNQLPIQQSGVTLFIWHSVIGEVRQWALAWNLQLKEVFACRCQVFSFYRQTFQLLCLHLKCCFRFTFAQPGVLIHEYVVHQPKIHFYVSRNQNEVMIFPCCPNPHARKRVPRVNSGLQCLTPACDQLHLTSKPSSISKVGLGSWTPAVQEWQIEESWRGSCEDPPPTRSHCKSLQRPCLGGFVALKAKHPMPTKRSPKQRLLFVAPLWKLMVNIGCLDSRNRSQPESAQNLWIPRFHDKCWTKNLMKCNEDNFGTRNCVWLFANHTDWQCYGWKRSQAKKKFQGFECSQISLWTVPKERI